MLLIYRSGRISNKDRSRRHVSRNDRPRSDESCFADANATEDNGTGSERGTTLDRRPQKRPVALALQPAFRRCAWELVVHEYDPVAHEDLVADLDPVTDERVTLNLAIGPDYCSTLDLDERSNACVVADTAAVEVRERVYDNALAEAHVLDEAVRRIVRRLIRHG